MFVRELQCATWLPETKTSIGLKSSQSPRLTTLEMHKKESSSKLDLLLFFCLVNIPLPWNLHCTGVSLWSILLFLSLLNVLNNGIYYIGENSVFNLEITAKQMWNMSRARFSISACNLLSSWEQRSVYIFFLHEHCVSRYWLCRRFLWQSSIKCDAGWALIGCSGESPEASLTLSGAKFRGGKDEKYMVGRITRGPLIFFTIHSFFLLGSFIR